MKLPSSLLLILAAACASATDAPAPDVMSVPYDRSLRLREQGLAPDADSLAQLVKTWPKTDQALAAQQTLDAAALLEEAQQRLKAGKYGTAVVAFRALISVYPESPLVKQAVAQLRTAEALEQKHSKAVIVRSLRFENIRPVTVPEILQRFDERELAVGVEKPFDAAMFDEARAAMAALLAERGVSQPHVLLTTRVASSHRVEVTFRVIKN